MNKILQSTLKTLNRTDFILSLLNDELLSDATIPPYKSSIGSHIRHILDFYNCILNLNSENRVDLTLRKRDLLVESNCYAALQYCNHIKDKLMLINYDFDKSVTVVDDLGMGKIEINYTLGALFAQANSHTIHHYAIINYIMEGLRITVNDADFGYNPTTPKPSALN
ncbi:hypothetical protein GCM10007962_06460 [Yeosuana aromativorans]|uniref:DinB family protein n=1 Tax=Yeosuana aromativorans TaxID=288019 RepID=A0A8J3FHM1_9FLAO|nr:hypothetical protein [Yeosuana aromativorans]GGK15001.1 hypothetical protein GCM10007962_06460 [Yeosuana aromativorans]